MKIIPARKKDAHFIARSIVWAVGEELARKLAGNDHTPEDVHTLFRELAEREDTQYSYRNTIVAIDDNDEAVGALIAYDGAKLRILKEPFISACREKFGKDMSAMGDECDADEYYIDTLAVDPAYRGRGIARRLLEAGVDMAKPVGKPAGLLVEKNNHRARHLYEKTGFRKIGERPFASEIMDHLIHSEDAENRKGLFQNCEK